MKITMLSIGSVGDVRPYIILGKELKSRNHSVTIAVFPQFKKIVQEAGLRFFSLDGDSESMMNAIMQPDTNGISYFPRLVKNMKSHIDDLIQSMVDSCSDADAMICNFFGTLYYSIAELNTIPCIQTHFFPMDPTGEIPMSSVRNQHLGRYGNLASYKIGYMSMSLIERYFLADWRMDHHLMKRKIATRPDYTVGDHPIPVIYAISPCVFPRPQEWSQEIHMSGFWFEKNPAAWTPSAEIEAFLENGAKPIYIGFGSMSAGDMNKLLTIVLRSVRTTGVRAVINLGKTGRKFKSNQHILFLNEVPHDWLFPRVAAVIHHGGAGTTAAGLRYGRPTLIIPFAGDQPFWGDQIRKKRCGPKPIPRKNLSVRKLAAGILDLLSNPDYAKNAADIAEALEKENGIQTAADIIEQGIASW